PITHETIEREGEACGPVLLKECVADPGESVSDYGQRRQCSPDLGCDCVDHRLQDQGGADEMQSPARPVTVFGEIEGIELLEIFEVSSSHGMACGQRPIPRCLMNRPRTYALPEQGNNIALLVRRSRY